MESLKTSGLIHPIVMTDDLRLVAGARRLEATKRLGATMIEVRRVGDLTEQERTISELEENLHRKNLTPIERSQTTIRLADAVGERLREKAQTQAAQGSEPTHDADVHTETSANPGPDELLSPATNNPKGGREEMPDSQAKVAAEIGMAQPTVSAARRHLKAVERYPELGAPDVSQREALRLYKAWEAMAPTNRSRVRKTWNAQRQAQQDQAEGAPVAPKAPTAKAKKPRAKGTQPSAVPAQVRLTRTWYVFTAGLLQVINDFERSGGTAPLLEFWTTEELARAQAQPKERLAPLERVNRDLSNGVPKGTEMGGLRVIHGQEGQRDGTGAEDRARRPRFRPTAARHDDPAPRPGGVADGGGARPGLHRRRNHQCGLMGGDCGLAAHHICRDYGLLRTFGEGCPEVFVIEAVIQLSRLWGYRSNNFSTQCVGLKTPHQKCIRARLWAQNRPYLRAHQPLFAVRYRSCPPTGALS
jgi:ParB-like chromosome segregation protein Spo0J